MDISVASFTDIQPIVTTELWDIIRPLIFRKINTVFTSAQAVRTLELHYLHQPGSYYVVGGNWHIHCLEGGTLTAVQEVLQHNPVKATAANATDLANAILQLGGITEVYFFCSRQRREELPSILKDHGITVHEIALYENVPTPVITNADYDGILFFSPSAVSSFFSVNRLPKSTVCFAIGQTTAGTLENFTDNRIIISTSPSAASMVQTAIFYFNNNNCYE